MEEDLYFPIILMMDPDLQQVTVSLPVALVYLKHLFLMMYCLWWSSAEVFRVQV